MLFPAALFIRRTGQLPQNLKNSCDFSCFIHNYKYNNICANVIRKMRIPVYLEERAYMAYSSSGGAGPCDMEKIKEVLNMIPGGVGSIGFAHGVYSRKFFNDGYFRMLNTTRQAYAPYDGDKAAEGLHPQDAAYVLAAMDKARKTGLPADVTYRAVNGENTYTWLRMNARIVSDTGDEAVFFCSFTDVDAQVRQNMELKLKYEQQLTLSRLMSSEAQLSLLVNLSRDKSALQTSRCPETTRKIEGCAPREIFRIIAENIPDEKLKKEYLSIFDTGIMTGDFSSGITHKSLIHPYNSMNSWMESNYDAIQNPQTGDVIAFYVLRDVTRQVQLKQVTTAMLSHEYESVSIINAETGEPAVLVNTGEGRVFAEQKKQEDFIGGLENYFRKFSADDDPEKTLRDCGLEAVKAALKKDPSYYVSYSVYDADRNIIRKRATYSYLNHYKTDIFCAVQDVTADFEAEVRQREILQKALADAAKANAAKSDFLSRMSHDIRTPLNGILGMAELAVENNTDTEIQSYLDDIIASGRFLMTLVNDILDISKIESGEMRLHKDIVPLEKFDQAVDSVIRPLMEAKDIEFKYHMNCGMTCTRCDSLRFNQLFFNLLSNAAKFTPRGGKVEFTSEKLMEDSKIEWVRFVIRDTGVGMSPDFLPHAFEDFEQDNAAVAGQQFQGTGLGLAIVGRITRMMHGRISIKSELGKGTEVTVELPMEKAVMETAPDEPQICCQLDLRGKSVLLAEDNDINRKLAVSLLRSRGIIAVPTVNGQEAVERFRTSTPGEFAAILMDIRMPVMNGLDAAKAIRAMDRPDAGTVPIIAMTANAYEDDREKTRAAGMNEHITKPLSPSGFSRRWKSIFQRESAVSKRRLYRERQVRS